MSILKKKTKLIKNSNILKFNKSFIEFVLYKIPQILSSNHTPLNYICVRNV
jgi:hypothetical protein